MSDFVRRRRTVLTMVGLVLLFGGVFQASAPLRASQGARITADEPFYLMTTHSLWTDGDIDLRDEYEHESYRSFYDHLRPLWHQSKPAPDGTELAPHQLGLSVLVLPAYAASGLNGVKAFLGGLGGLTVALTFLLAFNVTGRYWESLAATAMIGSAAPIFVYSTQIYPEMPAALLVVVGANTVLGTRKSWSGDAVVIAACVIGLAWLGVKYAPVAAVLAGLGLWRGHGGSRAVLAAVLLTGGIGYFWFHQATYGGLTPYAVNAIYAGDGTAEIIDQHLSFGDRIYRLIGLWVDRDFGIIRWAPALLLAVPGAYFAVRRTPGVGVAIVAIIAAQLIVAAFLAITMRGWWFPGRQMVVVLPLLAVPLAYALVEWRRNLTAMVLVAMAAAYGIAVCVFLREAVAAREITLAVDPFALAWPGFQKLASFFPLYTSYGLDTWLLTAGWCAAAAAILIAAWSTAPPRALLRTLRSRASERIRLVAIVYSPVMGGKR